MKFDEGLSTVAVQEIFSQEVAQRGGTVTDRHRDRHSLYVRGTLPGIDTVQRGDDVKAGVALRMLDHEASVHTYIFRLICRNGLVIPRLMHTQRVADLDRPDTDEAAEDLRAAIAQGASPEAFTGALRSLREATRVDAEDVVPIITRITRLLGRSHPRAAFDVMQEFMVAADRTRYGLVNAITATARKTPDPRVKWELEELGGAILIGTPEPTPQLGAASRHEVEVPVG